MKHLDTCINNCSTDINLVKLRILYSCIDEVALGVYIAVDYQSNRLTYYNSNKHKIINFSIDKQYIVNGAIIEIEYQGNIKLLSITTNKIIELHNNECTKLNIYNKNEVEVIIIDYYNLSLDGLIIDCTSGKQIFKGKIRNLMVRNNKNGPFWSKHGILATFGSVDESSITKGLLTHVLYKTGVEKLDTFIRRTFGNPEYLSDGNIVINCKNTKNQYNLILDVFGQLLYKVNRDDNYG